MEYRSKPTEIEAMKWHDGADMDCTDFTPRGCAQAIVAWVNDNGGEARYEPHIHAYYVSPNGYDRPARIAVRTINGWTYAAPGHYIVMGSAWFLGTNGPDPDGPAWRVRNFYPLDSETFESRRESLGDQQ